MRVIIDGTLTLERLEASFVDIVQPDCAILRLPLNLRPQGFASEGALSQLVITWARIYCDTGAILPIAYAIAQLRNRIDTKLPWPSIDSFGSYKGLDSFEFSESRDSIILISASTTGGLSQRVREVEPTFSSSQVLTLYFLGKGLPSHGQAPNIICNLGHSSVPRIKEFEPFESYESQQHCEFCSRGWQRITLDDDHFIPGSSHVRPVMIRRSCSPGIWLSIFINQTRGRSVVKAFYHDDFGKYEVFLDISRMLEDLREGDHLKSKLEWMITQNVPRSVTRIIHLQDSASLAMAKHIAGVLGPSLPIYSIDEIVGDRSKITVRGASIVVASAVASGRSLLGVAQQMRNLQPNGAFHYFVAIVRTETKKRLDDLTGNLCVGDKPQGFWYLQDLYLASNARMFRSAWEDELTFLQSLELRSLSPKASSFVEARLQSLRQASDLRRTGLEHDLFMDSPSGRMQLRKGFVFLDFEFDTGDVSQAETFLVVSAVLNHMRNTDGENSLKQSNFVRSVLSPRCFDRFNDGAIQSALLRAALPAEIDYSSDETQSAEMKSIIEVVFANSESQIGEAAREFALALATKRLRLCPADLTDLSKELPSNCSDPIACEILCQILPGRLASPTTI